MHLSTLLTLLLGSIAILMLGLGTWWRSRTRFKRETRKLVEAWQAKTVKELRERAARRPE